MSGADGGTRTRDLFLTKEVLYLLSYISVSIILTVYGDLSLPAFLPPAGVTKELVEKWSRKNKMQYIGEMFAATILYSAQMPLQGKTRSNSKQPETVICLLLFAVFSF